jgi:hypothetical protein
MPRRDDPQPLARAHRLELALRERDPIGVLDAIERYRRGRGEAGFGERAFEDRIDVGVGLEEGGEPRAGPRGGSAPGSPKTARSTGVPASASVTSIASAPRTSSASPSPSAWRPSIARDSRCQDIRRCGSFLGMFHPVGSFLDHGSTASAWIDFNAAIFSSRKWMLTPPRMNGRVVHELLVQGDVGLYPLDHHLGEGDAHACDRLLAGVAVGDQLAHERVVVRRDVVVGVDVRVVADAGATAT